MSDTITDKTTLPNFYSIKGRDNPSAFKKIYSIISGKIGGDGVLDSVSPISHSSDEITKIRGLLYAEVQRGLQIDGNLRTLSTAKQEVEKFVKDSFYNPVTGIGTNADPGIYNYATTPISLSPNEATALYSSGGIARTIIDKKFRGVLLNGFSFCGKDWENIEIEELVDYAKSLGLEKALKDGFRDGLVYGGSAVIPEFKTDSLNSYQYNIRQLKRYIKKDSLNFFWTADRWNLVHVPNFNISAKDYIHPEFLYCTIAGKNVNTARVAMIKPNMLPYWGTLRQIGWGQAEAEGWASSVLAYNVMMGSIPIMSQQMSLLYHHIPLDGLIAQNGPEAAETFSKENSKALAQWSLTNPKTFNSFGEIKSVERNFTNYDNLAMLLRQDISAKSRLAESSIWYTQPSGFDNNDSDVTVRDAETMRLLGNDLAPQCKPLVQMLVYSLWGPDSPQAQKVDSLNITFDSPTVMTSDDKAKMGNSFASIVQTLNSSGAPLDISAKIAKNFITGVDITDEMMKDFSEAQEKIDEQEQVKNDLEIASMKQKSDDSSEKSSGENKKSPDSSKKGPSKNGENTTRMSPSTKAEPGSENFLRRLGKKITGKGKSGG